MAAEHVQRLESRNLFSATLVSEPVTGYAAVAEKVRVAYLPVLQVSHVSQLRAEISWGDSTSSPASFERDKHGGIDVVGTHTYAAPGTFSIGGLISETPYPAPGRPVPEFIALLGYVDATATIAPTPARLSEKVGVPFTAALGSFSLPPIEIKFSTSVDWGDGNTTPAVLISKTVGMGYDLTATHTYCSAGQFPVHAYVYSNPPAGHGKPTLLEDFLTLITVTK